LTSMEPLFFKAENAQKKRHTRRRGACPASMEPLFFKAENEHACRLAAGRRSGFNGAAFFQSGKSHRRVYQFSAQRASMEPLFFKAENPTIPLTGAPQQ